jgi:uncharacterized protein DUF4384
MHTQIDKLDATVKNVFSKYKKLNAKPSKCPDDELLVAYFNENLSQNEIERTEEHLLVCKKCTENLLCFSQAESSYCPARKTLVTNKMVNRAKALVKPKISLFIWEIISSRFSIFIRHAPVMVFATCFMAAIIFSIHYTETPLSARLGIIVKKPSMSISSYNIPPTAGSNVLAKDYEELEIENGETLNSGDKYRINFKLTKEAYVYLIYLDSNGNLNLILQEDALKIKPDKNYSFPKTDKWLQVGKNVGRKTFYLIASQKPIEDIDLKIEELKESGIEKIEDIFFQAQIQSFYFTGE